VSDALGVLEVSGLTPSMAALDAMEKAAGVEVLQAEINDLLDVCIKIGGPVDAVRTSIDAGKRIAEQMGATVIGRVIARVDDRAMEAILSPPEFNPLIQQDVVFNPRSSGPSGAAPARKGAAVDIDSGLALGFIETQGFTAVFAAIDTACAAIGVTIHDHVIIGKETDASFRALGLL